MTERLPDGREVVLRAVRPADRDALREGFRHLSPDSVYFRFLGARGALSDDELDFLSHPDFDRHVAIGAEIVENGRAVAVAVARYIRVDDGVAEFAVAVDDAHQHIGIGTLLLKHLGRLAQGQGIVRLEGTVLAANRGMLDMLAHLRQVAGLRVDEQFEDGTVKVTLSPPAQ